MNTKPICIASAAASFIIACALEGCGLTIEQALLLLLPMLILLVWSFCRTDWYDPIKQIDETKYETIIFNSIEERKWNYYGKNKN